MFKPPKGENGVIWHVGLMIVALTLMCAVGFLFLYFKSSLDVKQLSEEIGVLRSMGGQTSSVKKGRLADLANKQAIPPADMNEVIVSLDGSKSAATVNVGQPVRVSEANGRNAGYLVLLGINGELAEFVDLYDSTYGQVMSAAGQGFAIFYPGGLYSVHVRSVDPATQTAQVDIVEGPRGQY